MMPGPIFFFTITQQRAMSAVERWAMGQLANAAAKAVVEQMINDPTDPMHLRAYGISRPHVDGKMAPPGLPWIGKAKGRKRK